jgi:hypothetical protein
MYAFGDALLAIFLALLFLIPTVFLVRVMANFEAVYGRYSRALLALSLTAPACLAMLCLGGDRTPALIAALGTYRLFASPFILVGMAVSRWFGRRSAARHLISCAFLVEAVTLGVGVAVLARAAT